MNAALFMLYIFFAAEVKMAMIMVQLHVTYMGTYVCMSMMGRILDNVFKMKMWSVFLFSNMFIPGCNDTIQ